MAILHIVNDGRKYELDEDMLKYFATIYADCELNLNNTGQTYWQNHVQNLIKAAGMCHHNIDEETAEEILENYREYSEDMKSYQDIDYIKMIRKYFDEESSRSICRRISFQN